MTPRAEHEQWKRLAVKGNPDRAVSDDYRDTRMVTLPSSRVASLLADVDRHRYSLINFDGTGDVRGRKDVRFGPALFESQPAQTKNSLFTRSSLYLSGVKNTATNQCFT
jgi:hypothetical protein